MLSRSSRTQNETKQAKTQTKTTPNKNKQKHKNKQKQTKPKPNQTPSNYVTGTSCGWKRWIKARGDSLVSSQLMHDDSLCAMIKMAPNRKAWFQLTFRPQKWNLKAHMWYQLSPFPSSNVAICDGALFLWSAPVAFRAICDAAPPRQHSPILRSSALLRYSVLCFYSITHCNWHDIETMVCHLAICFPKQIPTPSNFKFILWLKTQLCKNNSTNLETCKTGFSVPKNLRLVSCSLVLVWNTLQRAENLKTANKRKMATPSHLFVTEWDEIN